MTAQVINLDDYKETSNLFFVRIDPEQKKPISYGHMCPISCRVDRERDPNIVFFTEEVTTEEIEVLDDLSIRVLARMEIHAPTSVRVGSEITLTGVPVGAMVWFDGEMRGLMDEEGTLDFTPEMPGAYKFKFVKEGFVPAEVSIEAV